MSKPQSIKIEPWTDFPKLPYSFITDGFVHEKLLNFKVNSQGGRSTVNVKATVNHDRAISEEVKLWFDLTQGRSFYSKLKSDSFRVQLDNGITEHWGKKWNLYAGISANKAIQNVQLRLGAAHIGEKCHTDNRLKIEAHPEKKSATWYNRTVVTQDKFIFGILAAYGLYDHVLAKNNLLFGYTHDANTSVYLRLVNNKFRQTGFNWSDINGYFDNVKIDLISSFKDWKYGIETTLNTKGKLFGSAQLVVQHPFENKWVVKGSVKTDYSASLLVRLPCIVFTGIGKTSIGISGKDLIGEKRSFSYGAQVELNV